MSKKMITTAITTVLTMGISQASIHAADAPASTTSTASTTNADMNMDPSPDMERCYGIAKAGQNDCGTNTHSCANEQKVDGDKNNWVSVPKGLCNKIVGGSLEPKDKA